MRSRYAPWLALLTLVAAGAAAAAGYALTAPKQYRATAQLLVSPVAPSDSAFAGLDVLRDTGGKRTAAADAAALLRSPQVAGAVAAQLALRRSARSLLDAVSTKVVDSSDVVATTATAASPAAAVQLANTFANVLVAQRTALFQADLARAIRRDETLVANGAGKAVANRLTTLRGFLGQPDPTVRVAAEATAPGNAASPNVVRIILEGVGAGVVAGLLAAAFLLAARSRDRRAGYDRDVERAALEQLVERLEARLAARETALTAREHDVQRALAELRSEQEAAAAVAPAAAQLEQREQQHAERVAAVQQRELALARRAAELSTRERELEARVAELEERARELDERAEELAEQTRKAAEAPPRPVIALAGDPGDGHFNLETLERLVEERGRDFPHRVEEWSSYLYFLRDYAAPDGSVPASFDGLIQETFAELVA